MRERATRWLWMVTGGASLGAGLIGLFLPLLPTVPFVLFAAFCFSRGNRRWEQWMLAHPRLGPIIQQWRLHRVVPLQAKLIATSMMAISCVGAWVVLPVAYGWVPALLCSLVAALLWQFPSAPPSSHSDAFGNKIDIPPQFAGASEPSRPLVIALLVLMMMVHALPYAWATVTLDTARDLAAAHRIVEGEAVLRGPVFNGLFHLGPIWFFLLAPVLALTKSQAVTLLWVGVLAALKLPLAYRLGRSIRDAELGLCLAALAAFPGWSSLGTVFPTHTVMVEAAAFTQLLLMLGLARGGRGGLWAWLGLAVGLALHAHPSAVFVLVFLPAVFWTRRSIFRWQECLCMALGVLLFALPLLPMLIAEFREGWPALAPTLAFASDSGAKISASNILKVFYGTFVSGPEAATGLIENSPWSVPMRVSIITLSTAALLAMVRVRVRSEIRVLALALIGALLVSLMLAAARSYTPFYMVLILLPFGCIAFALGARQLPIVRTWLFFACATVVSANAMLIFSAQSSRAQIDVARLSNVQNGVPKQVDAALLPAWQLDALARELCNRSNHDVVLHGYLAALYDASLALGPELQCRKRDGVLFSGPGSSASEHWLGLPPALALTLGLQLGRSWTDTPKHGVQALWPPKQLKAADRLHYPHHRASADLVTAHRWNVRSAAGSVLIMTDLLYPYRINRVETVWADQRPARRHAIANITQAWVCDHCTGEEIAWEVRGLSNDPDVLDIVAIALPNPERAQTLK